MTFLRFLVLREKTKNIRLISHRLVVVSRFQTSKRTRYNRLSPALFFLSLSLSLFVSLTFHRDPKLPRNNENVIFRDAYYYHRRQDTARSSRPPRVFIFPSLLFVVPRIVFSVFKVEIGIDSASVAFVQAHGTCSNSLRYLFLAPIQSSNSRLLHPAADFSLLRALACPPRAGFSSRNGVIDGGPFFLYF